MKKVLYYIILIQLLSCKTNSNSKIEVNSIVDKSATEIAVLNSNIRYVTAKSGLNYRKEPKGKIIGKFEFGEEVEIVKNTNIVESITDENKQIKGEWLGVITKNQPEIKYVFSGFLANKKDFEVVGNNFLNVIPPGYEIEYKAEGDLNGDQVNDIVAVVKRKENYKGEREVFILLKDKNVYKIDKISKTVFPNRFFSEESDFEMYYTENIAITNNELIIELYGTGPVGNNFSKFKYFGENYS